MPDPNPGLLSNPFSLQHARSVFAGTDPKKIAMLAPILFRDYYVVTDDFDITLSTARWTVASTGAATAITDFALSVARCGQLLGDTGTDDNAAIAIVGTNEVFDAADNPFMIIRWKVDAVTGLSFEIGFSDPKTDEALPAVTDVDTPAATGNGTTDVICVHMDTDQTLTTAALVAEGTTGAAAKTNIGTYTPTADVWQTFIIHFRANIGYCHIWDGDGYVGSYSVAQGPDAGVLVEPYALFRTRNTTQKNVRIDFITVGCERNQS